MNKIIIIALVMLSTSASYCSRRNIASKPKIGVGEFKRTEPSDLRKELDQHKKTIDEKREAYRDLVDTSEINIGAADFTQTQDILTRHFGDSQSQTPDIMPQNAAVAQRIPVMAEGIAGKTRDNIKALEELSTAVADNTISVIPAARRFDKIKATVSNPIKSRYKNSEAAASLAGDLGSLAEGQRQNLATLAKTTKRLADLRAFDEQQQGSTKLAEVEATASELLQKTAKHLLEKSAKIKELERQETELQENLKSIKQQKENLKKAQLKKLTDHQNFAAETGKIRSDSTQTRKSIANNKMKQVKRLFQLNKISQFLGMLARLGKFHDKRVKADITNLQDHLTNNLSRMQAIDGEVSGIFTTQEQHAQAIQKLTAEEAIASARLNEVRLELIEKQPEIDIAKEEDDQFFSDNIFGRSVITDAATLTRSIQEEIASLQDQKKALVSLIGSMDKKMAEKQAAFDKAINNIQDATGLIRRLNIRSEEGKAMTYDFAQFLTSGQPNLRDILDKFTSGAALA